MTQTLLEVIADLDLSLAAAVSVGATTATLTSAVDGNGVAIPAGKYGFTIDGDNSSKEFMVCDLSGTTLTNVQSITVQGVATSGFAQYHRQGAVVTITDWVIFKRMLNNLNGTTGFNSATPLNYDAEPSYSNPLTIPTVQYVLDVASGGSVSFNRQIISGDAGENVSAGDWVYYDVADGEWYLTDADITAKSVNVRIGKAIGAGTNGNPITGGIFVSGNETVGTYVAGTTYYLSNTAGALSTSAGTNSVIVGVGDANGDLILREVTPNQVDATQGDGATPSSINPFVTKIRRMTAGETITGATLPVPVYQNTTTNKYLICDGNDLTKLKFQGFAISSSTDNNLISVQFNGVVDGFSALDEGVPYYLSDTAGLIQNTPGTNEVMAGVAISPTQLLIQKGQRFASGTTTFTATANTVITTGFRPSVVRIYATTFTATGHATSWGAWTVLGGNNCAFTGWTNAPTENAGIIGNAWYLQMDAAVVSHSGNVTTITDTGFTLANTETSGATTANIMWEAEGNF